MAQIICECCDLCGKPLHFEDHRNGTRKTKDFQNGFCYEIGYSIGGWGHRENFGTFEGEICTQCYAIASEAAKVFIGTVQRLRDNKERQSDTVHSMRNSKPSPDGRSSQLLRLMSPFHKRIAS